MGAEMAPSVAPVAIEEVKAFLRVEGGGEDGLLAGLVRTATELCEVFTRQALIERDVEEMLTAGSGWMRLGQTPVRAILGVSIRSADGAESILAAGEHGIDIDASGDGWVRVSRAQQGRVMVRYRAGMGPDWNGVAEPLRQGIVRMVAHLYTHRDGTGASGPPAAVTALWLPYRRLRLG